MNLEIIKEPHPDLHVKCESVKAVTPDIVRLALDMQETMIKAEGVGLAAPQIGKLIRMFVVSHKDGVKTFINPDIYWRSITMDKEEEGCLSIPGTFVPVKRHKKIKVTYLDENGQKQDIEASGFFARVIQHENDHLDGILITDT